MKGRAFLPGAGGEWRRWRTTVDLTKEIPEVTNVTFAQRFSEKIDL